IRARTGGDRGNGRRHRQTKPGYDAHAVVGRGVSPFESRDRPDREVTTRNLCEIPLSGFFSHPIGPGAAQSVVVREPSAGLGSRAARRTTAPEGGTPTGMGVDVSRVLAPALAGADPGCRTGRGWGIGLSAVRVAGRIGGPGPPGPTA